MVTLTRDDDSGTHGQTIKQNPATPVAASQQQHDNATTPPLGHAAAGAYRGRADTACLCPRACGGERVAEARRETLRASASPVPLL